MNELTTYQPHYVELKNKKQTINLTIFLGEYNQPTNLVTPFKTKTVFNKKNRSTATAAAAAALEFLSHNIKTRSEGCSYNF